MELVRIPTTGEMKLVRSTERKPQERDRINMVKL
jgi:hypothetical protein